jgi:hypothetical protein
MVHKEKSLEDDLLIVSYILFLARYFYICDKRQIGVMQDYLLNTIGKSEDFHNITKIIFNMIFMTLNAEEKSLTARLFKFSVGLPPSFFNTYSLDDDITEKDFKPLFAKYIFRVIKQNNSRELSSYFLMSSGPDILLLPLTCGTLYEFVVDKLNNKDNKEKLDNIIIDLLKSHKDVDCRSIEGFINLPNQIINEHNLNY